MKETILTPDLRAVERKCDSVYLQLFVPAELEYFKGHFPGNPILPGVVQVHWALQYSQLYLKTPYTIKKLEAVKFRNLILPSMLLHLNLALTANGKLQFRYDHEEEQMSSGRVLFVTNIIQD